MKLDVTKEEYILNKVLTVLEESNFPRVKIAYFEGTSVLVFKYGSDVYSRSIHMNSISASIRELAEVTTQGFKEAWQKLSPENVDKLVLLDEFIHLVDESMLKENYIVHVIL